MYYCQWQRRGRGWRCTFRMNAEGVEISSALSQLRANEAESLLISLRLPGSSNHVNRIRDLRKYFVRNPHVHSVGNVPTAVPANVIPIDGALQFPSVANLGDNLPDVDSEGDIYSEVSEASSNELLFRRQFYRDIRRGNGDISEYDDYRESGESKFDSYCSRPAFNEYDYLMV